jgi:hypothetical protein
MTTTTRRGALGALASASVARPSSCCDRLGTERGVRPHSCRRPQSTGGSGKRGVPRPRGQVLGSLPREKCPNLPLSIARHIRPARALTGLAGLAGV